MDNYCPLTAKQISVGDGASIPSSLVIRSFANTALKYFSFLDVRSKREYDESHVITARRVKKVEWQSGNAHGAGWLSDEGGQWEILPRSGRQHGGGHCGQQR